MSATILTDENDSDTYKVNRALQYVYIIHCESNTYLTPVFKNDFLQFNVERFTTTQFFTQKYDKSANEYSKAKGKFVKLKRYRNNLSELRLGLEC